MRVVNFLILFMLPEYIFLQESLEDRQVPDVNNPQTQSARDEEGKGQNTEVEETLIIHPSDDEDPDEEGDNIKFCIPGKLQRCLVCLCNEMENPSLVENCIELCDEAENSKANGHISDKSPGKADDDEDMMEEEHARLAV